MNVCRTQATFQCIYSMKFVVTICPLQNFSEVHLLVSDFSVVPDLNPMLLQNVVLDRNILFELFSCTRYEAESQILISPQWIKTKSINHERRHKEVVLKTQL